MIRCGYDGIGFTTPVSISKLINNINETTILLDCFLIGSRPYMGLKGLCLEIRYYGKILLKLKLKIHELKFQLDLI